jgi:hypothetical protein
LGIPSARDLLEIIVLKKSRVTAASTEIKILCLSFFIRYSPFCRAGFSISEGKILYKIALSIRNGVALQAGA